jgi:hypothetical protein
MSKNKIEVERMREINPLKKKHIQILEEAERRLAENWKYCEQNACPPTQYMCGQNDVLSDLIVFINKL